MRDVICTFVSNLSYSHMIGCEEKVSSVRHDMGLQQWKSVARILVYGSRLNYFPLFLSPIILTAAFFGDESISVDCFIDGFKQYVLAEERDLLNPMFDSFHEHNKELMDLLSSYNCFRVPKENYFKNIIVELGVDPRVEVYYQLFWHDSLRSLLKKFQNVNNVFGFYKEISPTSTKVVKKLIFSDELNERQKQVSEFLKKYIKSLDKKDLKLFLRFLVGSDNMPVAINALQISYSCAKILCVYQPTSVGQELPVN